MGKRLDKKRIIVYIGNMKNKYEWMTRTQAAIKWGMKIQNVNIMLNSGRIDFWEPASGVVLIPINANRPEKLKPWGLKKLPM